MIKTKETISENVNYYINETVYSCLRYRVWSGMSGSGGIGTSKLSMIYGSIRYGTKTPVWNTTYNAIYEKIRTKVCDSRKKYEVF